MKYLKKTLSFVLSLAMVFTMVIVPRTGVAEAATTSTDTIKYFPVNMYRYHTYDNSSTSKNYKTSYSSTEDPFNYASRQETNDNGETGSKAMQFTDGSNINGVQQWNKWTGFFDASGDDSTVKDKDKYYPVTGLVGTELKDKKDIQFVHPEAGIFTNDDTTNKDIYKDVRMPFKVEKDKDGNPTGYYYLDSNEYDVYFEGGINGAEDGATLENSDNRTTVTSNQEVNNSTSVTGFFPFNKHDGTTDDNGNPEKAIFHFGMNMGIEFYMPEATTDENGNSVYKDKNGNDIIFEFSGDDDVWVFVDGNLVLDLGGIHDAISGDINFSTGEVTTYRGIKGTTDTKKAYIKDNEVVSKTETSTYLTGNEWKTKNTNGEAHNVQIFYLERGRTVSNCKIKFNLPQKDKLEVSKKLGNTNATDADKKGGLSEQKFKFKLQKKQTDGTWQTCTSEKYALFENNSLIGGGKYTDKDTGIFELKFDQKASFANLEPGTYRVLEESGNGYQTAWKTYINGELSGDSTTTSETTTDDSYIATSELTLQNKDGFNTYTYEFTNTVDATLVDDVVVVDYGKKIAIDVLANDISFHDSKTLTGIRKTSSDTLGTSALKLTNGEATIEGDKVMYRPFQYMSSIDRLQYSAKIKDKDYTADDEVGNVSIIPATTVYYEDNFGGTGTGADTDTEPGLAITYTGDWSEVSDGTTQNDNVQNDGSVGKGNDYGYDSTYSDDSKFSNGTAHVVEGEVVDGKLTASAGFTFTGTGFDIISRTDAECGLIRVKATNRETNKVVNVPVINKGSNTLYQIPVISCTGLDYGTYDVQIIVYGPDQSLNRGSTFYLDAIRIYEPMGSTVEQTSSDESAEGGKLTEAGVAYNKDKEIGYSDLIRDILIDDQQSFTDGQTTVNGQTVNGAVYIDTINGVKGDNTTKLDKYTSIGPNQEVYLSSGSAIAFTVDVGDKKPSKVCIGAKSPNNGNSSILKVTSLGNTRDPKSIEIKSATDMYYDITDYVTFREYTRTVTDENGEEMTDENGNKITKSGYEATIVIGNNASAGDNSILSLTNIKFGIDNEEASTIAKSATYSMSLSNYSKVRALATSMLSADIDTEEPVEPQKANLEIASAEFTSNRVSILKSATLKVKTSKDVNSLCILDSNGKVIEPLSISSDVDESLVGTDNDSVAKTWTVKIKFNKLGNQKIAVYGIGENGDASENVKEASVKVTLLGSIKDLFTEWW